MKRSVVKLPTHVRLTLPAFAFTCASLLAGPGYAAEADTADATKPMSGKRASIDPETGTLRAPEAGETALGTGPSAAARSSAAPSLLQSPNALRFQSQQMYGQAGAVGQRLDLRRALRFSVAHRDADGNLHKDCVVGPDGIHRHLSASGTQKGGANHE